MDTAFKKKIEEAENFISEFNNKIIELNKKKEDEITGIKSNFNIIKNRYNKMIKEARDSIIKLKEKEQKLMKNYRKD